MALITTLLEISGVLVALALFLFFSAYIESRQLGPVGSAITVDPGPEAVEVPVDPVVSPA